MNATSVNKLVMERMDLLRLVLAKQPLDRLFDFPVLLRSGHFLRTRRLTVNVRKEKPDYIKQCTMEGELCRFSFAYTTCQNLRNRAVFLRNAEAYRFFYNKTEEDQDIWYAVESGIPEIQAQALASISGGNADYFLSKFNDLSAIPWTKQLKKIVEELLGEVRGEYDYLDKMSYFLGYTGIKAPRGAKVDPKSFEFGEIDAFLLKPSIYEDTENYMRHLLGVVSNGVHTPYSLAVKLSIMRAKSIMEVYAESPGEYLRHVSEMEWDNIHITRSLILRVMQYMKDPEFQKAFKETKLMEAYLILSGYDIPASPQTLGLKRLCGIKVIAESMMPDQLYPTVQQMVKYRFGQVSTRTPVGRLAYLLGKVDEFKTPATRHEGLISEGIDDPDTIWKAQNLALVEAAIVYYGWEPSSVKYRSMVKLESSFSHFLELLTEEQL